MNGSKMSRVAWGLLVMAWLAQAGIAAAAAPRRLDRLGRATPFDSSVTFPTTAVGQTSTVCEGLCYSLNTSPPGTCDAPGPEALAHDVSLPFFAEDYVIGTRSSGCNGTPVNLPTNLSAGQALWFNIDFSPTFNGTFTDFLTISGFSFNLSGSTGISGSNCVPDSTTLCIDQIPGDGRFMIQVSYHTSQGGGLSGSGNAIALSSLGVNQGGLFWFFGATNPEMLIKIIDGCALNNRFWVFFAATTNVGFAVTVTDTVTGHQATYTNPDNHAAPPVQDTSALTCP